MTDAPGGQSIYLETNFFIKAVEGTSETSAAPKRLINLLKGRPQLAVTSEITFAETLAPTQRLDALPLHIKRRAYLDLLLWSGFIRLVPVSRDILIDTSDLRSLFRLKLPDAIHLASAVRGNCGCMVTADNDFERLPNGMTRVVPDDSGIETLLRRLS